MRTRTILPLVLSLVAISSTLTSRAFADNENFGANKEADLNKREEKGYGAHVGRVFAYGFTASGENFGRTTSTAPVAQGATPAVLKKDYSRIGALAEIHGSFFFDKTRFKTLLGFEASAAGGYGTLKYSDGIPDKDSKGDENKGSLILRTEFGPTFGLVDFGGAERGVRLTFLPAMGLYLDGGRFYDSYAYFSLGGRLSAHLSSSVDVHAQYIFVPGTTTDTWDIREHRMEAFANIGPLAVGARFQLDTVELADVPAPTVNPDGTKSPVQNTSSKNKTLGLLVGYAFE